MSAVEIVEHFKCLILEIKLNGKSVILTTCRSRSQSNDGFDNFSFKAWGQLIFHDIKETHVNMYPWRF